MKIILPKALRFSGALLKMGGLCLLAFTMQSHAADSITTASSARELADYLITGENSQDVGVYWHCEPLNTDQNVHLRLWSDENGFSGRQNVQWKVLGPQRVSITYEDGTFELSDISFGNERYVADSLEADDSSGASVYCQRVGPHRGQSAAENLFQDESGSLLERQLVLEESQFWNCNSDGSLDIRTLEFNAGSKGFISDEPMRWFVDEQYNVVMSLVRADVVIHGIDMTRADFMNGENSEQYAGENPNILSGYIGESKIECNLM